MKEEWRPCVGFEDFYEVSNIGRVRSIAFYSAKYKKVFKRKNPNLRTLDTTNEGYKRVLLSLYGVHHHWAVHRLVASAFIPNPDKLPFINHKDENPSNNIVDNLEWCTGKYNSNYGTLPKRISERMLLNHPQAKAVFQYTKDGVFITAFKSASEAGRAVGLKNGDLVCRVCKGKAKTAKGFIFKFAQ